MTVSCLPCARSKASMENIPPYLPLTDNPDHPSRTCELLLWFVFETRSHIIECCSPGSSMVFHIHIRTSFQRKASRIFSWCDVYTLAVRLTEKRWPLSRFVLCTCLVSENSKKPDLRSSGCSNAGITPTMSEVSTILYKFSWSSTHRCSGQNICGLHWNFLTF